MAPKIMKSRQIHDGYLTSHSEHYIGDDMRFFRVNEGLILFSSQSNFSYVGTCAPSDFLLVLWMKPRYFLWGYTCCKSFKNNKLKGNDSARHSVQHLELRIFKSLRTKIIQNFPPSFLITHVIVEDRWIKYVYCHSIRGLQLGSVTETNLFKV